MNGGIGVFFRTKSHGVLKNNKVIFKNFNFFIKTNNNYFLVDGKLNLIVHRKASLNI